MTASAAARVALALLAVALFIPPAYADGIAPNTRSLGYELRIENLREYQKTYAFILYPTSNSGFGYVLEDGVPLEGVMMNGKHGQTTQLYAMTRAALRKHDPKAPRVPHADDGRMVLVVDEPPKRAPVATAEIAPPPLVPLKDARWNLSRTFRIAKVTPTQLELELVEEVTQLRDGTRHVRTGKGEERTEPAPADWKTPPEPKDFGDLFQEMMKAGELVQGGAGANDPQAGPKVPVAPAAPTTSASPSGCGGCTTSRGEPGAACWTVLLAALAWVVRRRHA